MWKREESGRTQPSAPGPGDRMGAVAISNPATPAAGATSNQMGREVVNIGKSVIIKGELSGSEDLTIEGRVEGQIELREHVLTIGPNGKIKAEVFAKAVVVMGNVTGNIAASDKINIRENGSVEGDISAPTVAIAEGAHFRGNIEMQRPQTTQAVPSRPTSADARPRPNAGGTEKRAATPTQSPTARAAH